MTSLTDFIAQVRARLEKATPGPWEQGGCSGRMVLMRGSQGNGGCGYDIADVDTMANSNLIASCPTDLTRCLKIIEVLSGALEFYQTGRHWTLRPMIGETICDKGETARQARLEAERIAGGES